jgi:hypothetical protein
MNTLLETLLDRIGRQYEDRIAPDARHYLEVDIGREARALGLGELSARFAATHVVVPLKAPLPGMKVRIDGRTFVNYRRHRSGMAVPGYVADAAGLQTEAYRANDSMILNFA